MALVGEVNGVSNGKVLTAMVLFVERGVGR